MKISASIALLISLLPLSSSDIQIHSWIYSFKMDLSQPHIIAERSKLKYNFHLSNIWDLHVHLFYRSLALGHSKEIHKILKKKNKFQLRVLRSHTTGHSIWFFREFWTPRTCPPKTAKIKYVSRRKIKFKNHESCNKIAKYR